MFVSVYKRCLISEEQNTSSFWSELPCDFWKMLPTSLPISVKMQQKLSRLMCKQQQQQRQDVSAAFTRSHKTGSNWKKLLTLAGTHVPAALVKLKDLKIPGRHRTLDSLHSETFEFVGN